MEYVEVTFEELDDTEFRQALAEEGVHIVDVGRPIENDNLQGTVESAVASTSNATIVEARTVFAIDNHVYVVTGRGDSIRHPGDKPNPDIGYALAFARALRSIAHRVEKIAHGQVDHIDHISHMEHKPLDVWKAELLEKKLMGKGPQLDEEMFAKAQKQALEQAKAMRKERKRRIRKANAEASSN